MYLALHLLFGDTTLLQVHVNDDWTWPRSERGGCSRFESLFISRVATMAKTMLALLPLLLLGAACAEPVNLHGGNWDELVVSSGRNAFVKFYAPWYGRWP
jgi:hypothetical protein